MADNEHVDWIEAARQRLEMTMRTVDVVAHRLGATMLPSIITVQELEYHPEWQSLCFTASGLVKHVRRQKSSLDFFRNAIDSELEPLPIKEWQRGVWPLLISAAPRGTKAELDLGDLLLIKPSQSRALFSAIVAVDQLCGDPFAFSVSLTALNRGHATVRIFATDKDLTALQPLFDQGVPARLAASSSDFVSFEGQSGA